MWDKIGTLKFVTNIYSNIVQDSSFSASSAAPGIRPSRRVTSGRTLAPAEHAQLGAGQRPWADDQLKPVDSRHVPSAAGPRQDPSSEATAERSGPNSGIRVARCGDQGSRGPRRRPTAHRRLHKRPPAPGAPAAGPALPLERQWTLITGAAHTRPDRARWRTGAC